MKKVTTETITDDQIRQLRISLCIARKTYERALAELVECACAREPMPTRAHCAEIWNDRYGDKS